MMRNLRDTAANSWVRWIGLIAGPILAFALYFLLPTGNPDGAELSAAGRMTLVVTMLMAVWWITEALPIEATAMVPLGLFPVLGVADMKQTAAPYADPVIFLFLGGVMLGVAMERWGLHRRLAILTMLAVGTRLDRLVAGLMLITAAISMWISNTATAVMMLPIGMSVVRFVTDQLQANPLAAIDARSASHFAKCILLGIAYAATIGGIGTVIGTPPNAVAVGFIHRTYGVDLSFVDWLKIGLPLMLLFLPLCWIVLVKLVFPFLAPNVVGVGEVLRGELTKLGPLSRGEVLIAVVFVAAAIAWIVRQPLAYFLGLVVQRSGAMPEYLLTDAGIAMIAALLLFVTPVDLKHRVFLLDWPHAVRLPWGVLLLLGGGLTLAAAFEANGVDKYLGAQLSGLTEFHPLAVVAVITAVVVFTTEFASNTAIVNVFLPISAAVALKLGVHPYLLIFSTTLAASYAFMMPMGTPPNALVFASGHLRVPDMAKAGILLNLLSIVLITLLIYFGAPLFLGFDPRSLPGVEGPGHAGRVQGWAHF